ncbi:MAG: hypothetical protein ACUVTG_16395 [Candidatus Oleimicrobiaceae bacterium]
MSKAIQVGHALTLIAAADIAKGQAVTATGGVPDAGAPIAGVAIFAARQGQPVTVAPAGSIVEGRSGSSFAAGAQLGVDTEGHFVEYSSGAVTALAVEAATGPDQLVLVLVK